MSHPIFDSLASECRCCACSPRRWRMRPGEVVGHVHGLGLVKKGREKVLVRQRLALADEERGVAVPERTGVWSRHRVVAI